MSRKSIPLIILLVLAASAEANAQDSVTLSTYHPSPIGVYKELRTVSNACLATQTGEVVIGKAMGQLLSGSGEIVVFVNLQ